MFNVLCKGLMFCLCSLVLISCGSDGGSGSGSDSDTNNHIKIVEAESFDKTLYSSRSSKVHYGLDVAKDADNASISFYLVHKDDQNKGYFIGLDYFEHLMAGDKLENTITVDIPGEVPAGEYYLRGHVNEIADETSDFTSFSTYTVDDSLVGVTNIKVIDMYSDDYSVVLDPHDNNPSEDLHPDLEHDNITALKQGMMDKPDFNGHAIVEIDGPLPESDNITMTFEISLDNGSTWIPLELWNNEEQAYKNYVNVDFPGYDEGSHTQDITILANFSDDHHDQIHQEIADRVNDYTDSLEHAKTIQVRTKAHIPGAAEDTDDTHYFDITVFSLPPSASSVNQKNLSAVSGDKKFFQHKNWDVGSKSKVRIGAHYLGKAYLYDGSSDDKYGAGAWISFQARGPLYIFNHYEELYDAWARVSGFIEKPGDTGYHYYFRFLGSTLLSSDKWDVDQYTKSLGKSWSKSKTFVNARFWAGPIPFNLKGGVTGSLGMSGNLVADPTGVSVNAKLPYVKFDAILKGGVDAWVASAGITSSLNIINNTVSSTNKLNVSYDGYKLAGANYNVAVTEHLKAISGKLGIYATINYLFGSKTYRNWFYHTNPLLNYPYTIFSERGSL